MNLPFKIGISPQLKIRGLIATEQIAKGSIIEKCPTVLIDIKDEECLEKTNLTRYYFKYSDEFHAVGLGYVSLANHSFEPNCELEYDFDNQTISLKALVNIKKGEELTFEYMDKEEAKLFPELFDFNKGIK